MSKLDSSFFETLANDLQPGRQWSPLKRSLTWGFILLVANLVAILAYQAFRPGFATQLLTHWRFALEIVTGSLFISLLIYVGFVSMVPGRKLKNISIGLLGASFIVWLGSVLISFFSPSIEVSKLGARGLCVEEVAVYGLVGALGYCWFIRKSHFQFSRLQFAMMGISSALIPGILMQLSCMYSPLHVILHYVPALLIGLLAMALLPLFKRKA